ncbi:MAG: acetoacetate decarboxylase family protein [Chthoniobacteraceae bacterium]
MLPHPYEVKSVTGYGVAMKGTRTTMQALVDRLLNCGKHEPHYYVVSPTVLCTFMRMGCMECAGHPQMGSFAERELNLTLLLAAVEGFSIRLVWYMPYLWLDSGPALIAGRDIYGFTKQIAKILIPKLGDPVELSAIGEVLPLANGLPAEDKTIVSVSHKTKGLLEKKSDSTNMAEALSILLKSVMEFEPEPIEQLALHLPAINLGNLRMAWMRQLPSISDFTKTCFRSVAEAPFSVTLRSAGLLAGNFEVSIPWYHSVRLVKELGLVDDHGNCTPDENLMTTARAAYHMDFDFILGKGQDLWVET